MNYRDYIVSDHWARRRAKFFVTHTRICGSCATDRDVHLHHLTYDRLGEEVDADLLPLCQGCHGIVHRYHDMVGGNLAEATRAAIQEMRRPSTRTPPPPEAELPAVVKPYRPSHHGGREGRLGGLPITVRGPKAP